MIGTLWPIKDNATLKIAGSFYTLIGQHGSQGCQPPDFAAALHETIRAVRGDSPSSPFNWAAHVHVGC